MSKITQTRVIDILNQIKASNQTISILKVAKELGVSHSLLYKSYPAYIELIKQQIEEQKSISLKPVLAAPIKHEIKKLRKTIRDLKAIIKKLEKKNKDNLALILSFKNPGSFLFKPKNED